ncbi:hypothetical protein F4782DRAFT_476263 [Xylaria castorea]|nr:hypothetical protein F4782DRAFT_476263 [Xylaria castorea]
MKTHMIFAISHLSTAGVKTMVAPKDSTGSLQPWYKRRANTHTMSVHGILVLTSFVAILLALIFLFIVDATVPATLDMALLNVRNPYQTVNGESPVLKLGTFGYCIDWEYHPGASATQSPMCYGGNGYNTAGIDMYFKKEDFPVGYIARLTPATSSLYPLNTALVFLVLVTAALPCFVPAIFAVALSWLATASSIAAVVSTFSLALEVRSRLHIPYVFGYGLGIWALLAGAISIWVFTVLLTTAWWLHRRSDRRNLGEPIDKQGPAHGLPDAGAFVESQGGELSGEVPFRELHEGENAHRHELLNTDRRERGRIESGAEERYELDAPERSRFRRGRHHNLA